MSQGNTSRESYWWFAVRGSLPVAKLRWAHHSRRGASWQCRTLQVRSSSLFQCHDAPELETENLIL